MPRPRLDLGADWKTELAEKLEPILIEALKKQEAMSENCLESTAINALGELAGLTELGNRLKKLWSLQGGRKLSDTTTINAVLRNLRAVLRIVKNRLLNSEYCNDKYGTTIGRIDRRIQFGRKNFGMLYFAKTPSWKEAVSGLARKLILENAGGDSAARSILDALERNDGYVLVKSIPHQYRSIQQAANLLQSYFLTEKKTTPGGKKIITVPGFAVENLSSAVAVARCGMTDTDNGAVSGTAREFFERGAKNPDSLDFRDNFVAKAWTLGPEGPKVCRITFSLVVFDRQGPVLHVVDSARKRAGSPAVRELHRKKLQWGLPARMHLFAPGFTKSAQRLANELGIQLHEKP